MIFEFEICACLHYFVLNFYQINRDSKIQTYDRLIIKILISCQKIKSSNHIIL